MCTVGDEKQSIYRFRGADVDVYRRHREQMEREGALVAELDVNYRSHPDILGFVNSVFGSQDYFGHDASEARAPPADARGDPLDPLLGGSPRIEVIFVDSTDVDAAGRQRCRGSGDRRTARRVCAREALAPRDIAVLLRTYKHAHVYAEALSACGPACSRRRRQPVLQPSRDYHHARAQHARSPTSRTAWLWAS